MLFVDSATVVWLILFVVHFRNTFGETIDISAACVLVWLRFWFYFNTGLRLIPVSNQNAIIIIISWIIYFFWWNRWFGAFKIVPLFVGFFIKVCFYFPSCFLSKYTISLFSSYKIVNSIDLFLVLNKFKVLSIGAAIKSMFTNSTGSKPSSSTTSSMTSPVHW